MMARKIPREVDQKSLSPVQQSVLVGTLLGDGNLNRQHRVFHRLYIRHGASQGVYAEWKRSVFSPFVRMPVHYFLQNVGQKQYGFCQFASRTHPEFTKIANLFYRNTKKFVPKTIDRMLTPLALAVWVMDDGTRNGNGLCLQTNAFSTHDVEILKKALKTRFEIETSMYRNKRKYILYIPVREMNKLRTLIMPHLLPMFHYKVLPRRDCTLVSTHVENETVRSAA